MLTFVLYMTRPVVYNMYQNKPISDVSFAMLTDEPQQIPVGGKSFDWQ